MRARDVVGRRIVEIEQVRKQCTTYGGHAVTAIQAIMLDDGTRITFTGVEVEYGDPVVTANAIKPMRRRDE